MAGNDTDDAPPDETEASRREFMATSGAAVSLGGGALVSGTGRVSLAPEVTRTSRIEDPPDGVTRRWLGPELWGNRLQDWRCHDGRIECLRGEAGYEVRTVAVLTREVGPGDVPGRLRVVTGRLDDGTGAGFCGFLLGVGGDDLDYRAAALAQRGSGSGGGLLCTFEADGQVRFRDHTSESNSLKFEPLTAERRTDAETGRRPAPDDEVALELDIVPRGGDRFDVELKAVDAASGAPFSDAVRRNVPGRALRGGISLVSSPVGESGSRWWFEGFESAGPKITRHPERQFGPIAGTLYSLDDDVLKLSAQLLPVADRDGATVELWSRPAGSDGKWLTVPPTTVDRGFTARFRVEDWDGREDWEYRVVYEDGGGREWTYDGTIRANPRNADELDVGLFSCTIAAARRLEAGRPDASLPEEDVPGRYTPENIYFPYRTLVEDVSAADPDLLVFCGDQIYENSPTRVAERADPTLDYLYKWYLWLWSFRSLTRDRPSILLVDDHDIYQPNLWGHGGERAGDDWDEGGFVGDASFVNTVQRTQCGHNPDPYDPGSAERGIDVYYGAFEYGGVSFAVLEDRKFKSPPKVDGSVRRRERELLGPDQEQFLSKWAGASPEKPKVCLTQTTFACAQTSPSGERLLDYDTNGYPKRGRDRAVERLRDAGALVLAGDQHLATLMRHGVEDATDGVIQFSAPAAGAVYQRWFEPAASLPNGTDLPNTGDYVDGFGNRFRMLAVANPEVSFERFREAHPNDQTLWDRSLKSEGFGLVRIDRADEAFVVECWPLDADPTDPDATQFDGWPRRIPFDETGG